ncbi:hypothetical protein BDV96DRAFT_240737 [Lophiotrema nucula]|uniref:Uncharacterized protein n=1 Tax=Lophiotrema nucula TaxID=690887 RepID=A0A6A5YPW7_9PLEO|nr:hypothetical protein BDV96DRAFT_240737 [Lophiotrema nucula]
MIPKYQELVEQYEIADEPERHRLRRRIERLHRHFASGSGETAEGSETRSTPAPTKTTSPSKTTPTEAGHIADATAVVEDFDGDDDGVGPGSWKQRRIQREQDRALWESTLPEATNEYPGNIDPGYKYHYISHGKNAPIGGGYCQDSEQQDTPPGEDEPDESRRTRFPRNLVPRSHMIPR